MVKHILSFQCAWKEATCTSVGLYKMESVCFFFFKLHNGKVGDSSFLAWNMPDNFVIVEMPLASISRY